MLDPIEVEKNRRAKALLDHMFHTNLPREERAVAVARDVFAFRHGCLALLSAMLCVVVGFYVIDGPPWLQIPTGLLGLSTGWHTGKVLAHWWYK